MSTDVNRSDCIGSLVMFQINVRKKKGQSETLTILDAQDTRRKQKKRKKTTHTTQKTKKMRNADPPKKRMSTQVLTKDK